MYSLDQFERAWTNPALVFREANRLYYKRLKRYSYNEAGVDIFSEDWDNLIILDACRYDMFSNENTISGKLDYRISRGSSTIEFLKGNFQDRELNDTVYVTSNPQFYGNRNNLNSELHSVVNIWKDDGWDEELGTVLPETTTEYAKEAAREYDDKRIIVHYIQPHYPFIGSSLEEDKGHLEKGHIDGDDPGLNIWAKIMLEKVDIPEERVWEAYTENLNRALPSVENLIEELDGKTVITSDHGNMLGDRSGPFPISDWGHPSGIYTEELVKVPWLVHESGPRREITDGNESISRKTVTDEVVEDRLSELGYMG